MAELTIAQAILLLSLQNAGIQIEANTFEKKYTSTKAENLIIVLAEEHDRPRLKELLIKNATALSAQEIQFIDRTIQISTNKIISGRGVWD